MGTAHFHSKCISNSSPNRQVSNTSSPLISPSSRSCMVSLLISQEVIEFQKILSNYSMDNNSVYIADYYEEYKYSKSNPTGKHCVNINYDESMTFDSILNSINLLSLANIKAIKVYVGNDQINNMNDKLINFVELSTHKKKKDFVINIDICNEWFSNIKYYDTLNISNINKLIDNLWIELVESCAKLNKYSIFCELMRMYDIINNDILSKYVDIDQLIDETGNKLAQFEASILPCRSTYSTNKGRLLTQITKKLNKMEDDLRNIQIFWNNKCIQIEEYLRNALDQRISFILKQYETWNCEQILQWIQYLIADDAIVNNQNIETFKMKHLNGYNIYKTNHYILKEIGIINEDIRNNIIKCINELIDKYGNNKENISMNNIHNKTLTHKYQKIKTHRLSL